MIFVAENCRQPDNYMRIFSSSVLIINQIAHLVISMTEWRFGCTVETFPNISHRASFSWNFQKSDTIEDKHNLNGLSVQILHSNCNSDYFYCTQNCWSDRRSIHHLYAIHQMIISAQAFNRKEYLMNFLLATKIWTVEKVAPICKKMLNNKNLKHNDPGATKPYFFGGWTFADFTTAKLLEGLRIWAPTHLTGSRKITRKNNLSEQKAGVVVKDMKLRNKRFQIWTPFAQFPCTTPSITANLGAQQVFVKIPKRVFKSYAL